METIAKSLSPLASQASPSPTSLRVSATRSLMLTLGSQGKGHANGMHHSVVDREKEGILNDLRLLSERPRGTDQPESHDKVTCCSMLSPWCLGGASVKLMI